MAADKGEGSSRKWRKSDNASENHVDSEEEEEPDFSDPEDFIEDINDEGFSHFLSKNRPICSVTLASFTECMTKSLPDIIPSAHFCIGGHNPSRVFLKRGYNPFRSFLQVDRIPSVNFPTTTKSLLLNFQGE